MKEMYRASVGVEVCGHSSVVPSFRYFNVFTNLEAPRHSFFICPVPASWNILSPSVTSHTPGWFSASLAICSLRFL